MEIEKKYIVIIGTGKVAHQLGQQLFRVGHSINGVWGRDITKAKNLAKKLNSDVIDDLKKISKESLPKKSNLGVFYPLQTFSQDRNVDISVVPFLIEATTKSFEAELKTLAETLSSRVLIANSQDRYNTHIAAVMVNNFTNFLYHLAQEHLKAHHLDFDLLKPLIQETVAKLETLSPIEAQTGPATRGDQSIIQKHLKDITRPETQQLYRLFSDLIEKEIKKS